MAVGGAKVRAALSLVAVGMAPNYDRNCSFQMTAKKRHVGLLADALKHAERPGKVLTVADYGSATGLNSMMACTPAFQTFRSTSSTPIQVFHTDLPDNPWSVLFNNALSSPHSYLSLPDIYVAGVGRSFYEQVFPASSICVMHAANTLHWLSTHSSVACQLQKYVEGSPEIHMELRGLAERDFHSFLAHRSQELKPGGRLILQMFTTIFKQDYKYHALHQMQSEGLISPKPLERVKVMGYPISVDSFDSIMSHFPALKVIWLQKYHGLDDFYSEYLLDGDREKYAARRSEMNRAVNEGVMRQLFREERTDKDLVNVYFDYIRRYFHANPYAFAQDEFDAVLEKTHQ